MVDPLVAREKLSDRPLVGNVDRRRLQGRVASTGGLESSLSTRCDEHLGTTHERASRHGETDPGAAAEAELLVPSVLSELLARHPDARFEVRLGHDYAELFDDRIDVAIRRGPLPDSTSLNAKRLGSLAMICVASPKLAERFAGDLDADSIASLPWIRVGSKLEPFSLVVGRGKRPLEARIHPRISVDSQRVALSLAEASAGVARVNAFLARSALADGRLIEIIPEARSLESAFAVYPRRARPGRLLTELLAALAAACKRHDIWDRE